jgi:hypothetical protein
MSETKISSQQGYLQAHYECHQIGVIQKGIELDLVSKPEYGERWKAKDPLEEQRRAGNSLRGCISTSTTLHKGSQRETCPPESLALIMTVSAN